MTVSQAANLKIQGGPLGCGLYFISCDLRGIATRHNGRIIGSYTKLFLANKPTLRLGHIVKWGS